MASWLWTLCDRDGNAEEEITGSGRSLAFTRNAYPEAKTTLSHDDAITGVLLDLMAGGVPQLRCYRDGELWLSALLANIDEDAGESSSVTVTFRGAFWTVFGDGSASGRFTAVDRAPFTQVDAGQIAWTLIDDENEIAATGIQQGTIETTQLRDRTYSNKNIGVAITELTEVEGGFDFEVLPLDPTENDGALGEFTVYKEQGATREDVRFEYGPTTAANVKQVVRKTTPPINVVRAEGANGVVIEESDAASVAKYGRLVKTITATDVSETATLTAKAKDALRPEWVRIVEFTPDVALAPQPGDDYWLGDRIECYARRGSLYVAETPRINAITITLNESGQETSHGLAYQEEQS